MPDAFLYHQIFVFLKGDYQVAPDLIRSIEALCETKFLIPLIFEDAYYFRPWPADATLSYP